VTNMVPAKPIAIQGLSGEAPKKQTNKERIPNPMVKAPHRSARFMSAGGVRDMVWSTWLMDVGIEGGGDSSAENQMKELSPFSEA